MEQGMRDKPGAGVWVLTALLAVLGGLILVDFNSRLSRQPSVKEVRAIHSMQKINAEIGERFRQGVVMLHAKRYKEAIAAFHRVIQLAPEMPEAHANMGYALLGLQRYQAARDFFEGAIAIRPNQVNAYYGLAEALEGLHDRLGALGAMRAYVHLAPADDPYRRKAESAIWEWDEAEKLEKQNRAELPANTPDAVAGKPD